jgi:hypothetical protein
MTDAAEHVRLARRIRPAALLGAMAGALLILQFFFELVVPFPEGKHVEPSPVAMTLGVSLAASGGWMGVRYSLWSHLLAATTLAWGGLWLLLPPPGEAWRPTLYAAVGAGMWLLAADQIRLYVLYRRRVRRPDPEAARRIERALSIPPAARIDSGGREWLLHLDRDLAVLEHPEEMIAGTAIALEPERLSIGDRTLPCRIDDAGAAAIRAWISSRNAG